MADATVVVDFVANTRGLQKGAREAQSATSKIGGSLKSFGKAAAFGAAGAAVAGLTATLKIGWDEYAEGQKIAAQTNAVIKSTGGAANVSAKQVDALASSIMEKSGIDDEAIKSGENLLLTFTNIQNTAGRGNDIFNQTTAIMADMSTALGQDTTASAMQLGKALNNPIKGVTALQRVGVTFTDAQKKQIKALQEAGDTAGAQKIILQELQKEFGGSAEAAGKTLPGQLNIAKQTFNNFAGDLVAKMIPALLSFIEFVRREWPTVQRAIQATWSVVGPLLNAIAALVVGVVGIIRDHWGTIGPIFNAVAAVVRAAVTVIATLIRLLTALLRGDWSEAWTQAKNLVQAIVRLISAIIRAEITVWKTILSAAWTAIKAGVTAAWNAIKSGISSAVTAIGQELQKIATKITGVVASVKTAAGKVASAIKDAIVGAVNSAVSYVGGLGGKLVDKLEGIVKEVKTAAGKVASAIKGPINSVISAWNGLAFHIPSVSIPKVDIPGVGKIGGGKFGGQIIGFPDLPQLAQGGVVTAPTLALVGEGGGREIVAPERLLRQIVAEGGGQSFTLNLTTQRADPEDVAWGFRRLELLRTGR